MMKMMSLPTAVLFVVLLSATKGSDCLCPSYDLILQGFRSPNAHSLSSHSVA
eukprot:m.108334 g.108334  ORF g.108334 m.108334 type:complete len:52 (-) comp51737_c1_seq3:24-179(-)